MSAAKEIRSKIQSIKNTQKITRAMEMISASKMRKAQDRMLVSRPYAHRIEQVISHIAKSHSEYRHPYFEMREVNRVGYIIVSSDRGLCGGFNANLFKQLVRDMQQYHQKNIPADLCLIGSKAEGFFKRYGANVLASVSHFGDKPSGADLIGITKVMLDHYDAKRIDALYVVYNEFVNTMKQQPTIKQMLPLVPAENGNMDYHWDYIYEPDARELLDTLLTRYIESQVYQAVIENIASEQAARMVAMKNASDNAGEFISELQLIYNKARQAAITKELSEIVSGSEAV
jgi:F-type H+-transporting ATPase subunit gamma